MQRKRAQRDTIRASMYVATTRLSNKTIVYTMNKEHKKKQDAKATIIIIARTKYNDQHHTITPRKYARSSAHDVHALNPFLRHDAYESAFILFRRVPCTHSSGRRVNPIHKLKRRACLTHTFTAFDIRPRQRRILLVRPANTETTTTPVKYMHACTLNNIIIEHGVAALKGAGMGGGTDDLVGKHISVLNIILI